MHYSGFGKEGLLSVLLGEQKAWKNPEVTSRLAIELSASNKMAVIDKESHLRVFEREFVINVKKK